MNLLTILATVTAVVAGQLLLKMGMTRVGEISGDALRRPLHLAKRLASQPAVVAGLSLYVASAAGWIYVLSRNPLSFAYPFLGISYATVTLVAVVMLHEKLTTKQWVGVAFVVAGVILVALTG